jgi:hypothetical protein
MHCLRLSTARGLLACLLADFGRRLALPAGSLIDAGRHSLCLSMTKNTIRYLCAWKIMYKNAWSEGVVGRKLFRAVFL